MPNKKSAKKELRKSVKRQSDNNLVKNKTKDLIKKTKKSIEAKDSNVEKDFNQVIKAIDKMAKKGIIKKNTASRKKSKLQKKLNNLKK
jgi:small subunit ribosomal protein S20